MGKTDWTKRNKNMKNKLLVIEQLKTNPIIQIVCQKTGVSRATFYRWREQDKKFKESADKALKEGISFINDLAESQLLSSIKDKNMTAIIFWLKSHHSAYDTTKFQITTGDPQKDEPLSPEQQKLITQALQMASLLPQLPVIQTKNEKNIK